jgi:hypothetical protein
MKSQLIFNRIFAISDNKCSYFCNMNTAVAKFLLFVCIFSFTPLKEILKAPVLFIHYNIHLGETPEMTIREFLDMHYMHGLVMDKDFEQDQQLPFKVVDFVNLPVFLVTDNKEITFPQICPASSFISKMTFSFLCFKGDLFAGGIFHPPKIS